MTTYTITVEPTVAPSTISITYAENVSTAQPLAADGDEDYSSTMAGGFSTSLVTTYESNGNVIMASAISQSGGATYLSYPSYSIETVTDTASADTGSYTYDYTQNVSSATWETYAVVDFSNVNNGTITQSWNGAFTATDNNGSTTPSSTTISTTVQTSSTQTQYVFASETTTVLQSAQTQGVIAGTIVGSQLTTTSSTRVATFSTVNSFVESTNTIIVTQSAAVTAYNGNTGTRGTATVVLLGPNEALWIPTNTGFGNNLSLFASFVTGPTYTIVENIITQEPVTATLTAPALYKETTVTKSSTISTTAASTISLTPSSASVIPHTETKSVSTLSTRTTSFEEVVKTTESDTPAVFFSTWATTTMQASIGSVAWQSSFYQKSVVTSTSSAQLVGQSTFSTSLIVAPITDGLINPTTSNGSGTTLQTTSRTITFSQTVAPKWSLLEANTPYRTASSFYEARAAASRASLIARDAFAQGVTFKSTNEKKAAQTAMLQFPTKWTYTSGVTSVTASAWGDGITLTKKSATQTSVNATTESGNWVIGGAPNVTQSFGSMLNPLLVAPTGTAILVDLPGSRFTTAGSLSGTTEITTTSTISALSQRVASSVAPMWSVGDSTGLRWLTTQRNFSETLATSATF